jgi:tetratricopeptide (TPR) repeat protein
MNTPPGRHEARADWRAPDNWDRYELTELIGQGGMGRVYRAFDRKLRRTVALKFLRDEDPTLRQRLMQEAQAQARIQHEHVCEIYEVGEHQGHAYIAMQFIAGHSLAELQSSLSIEQKVRIIKQIAEAVHAAHRLGLAINDEASYTYRALADTYRWEAAWRTHTNSNAKPAIDAGLKLITKALEVNPGDARAMLLQGAFLKMRGDTDAARAAFDRAVNLNSNLRRLRDSEYARIEK